MKLKTDAVSAFAPASASNIGCGFDVMGFALEGPGDVVTAKTTSAFSGVRIQSITGDEGKLPLDPALNTAAIAATHFLDKINCTTGINLKIEKRMPFASGLGSSAASAAAAVTAINGLLEHPLQPPELLASVIAAEKAIGGTAHADNAAPSLLGGFVLIRTLEPAETIKLPVPSSLYYVLIHPQIKVSTAEARAALPVEIPLQTAVKQWAHTASLVHALHTDDMALLGRSVQDFVAEPVRAKKIPHYSMAKKTALQNGALACNISGSGPSLFAFCDNPEKVERVQKALRTFFTDKNIGCHIYTGNIRQRGAEIIV